MTLDAIDHGPESGPPMSCLACLKRVLLVQPRERREVPWSEAAREREMTLVELPEAMALLGATVADLNELDLPDLLGEAA